VRTAQYSVFCFRFVVQRLLHLFFFLNVFISLSVAQDEQHYNHGELNWQTLETKHFFVHFHNGAERTARTIAIIAEDIYGPVTTLYQHEPDHKVSFIIKDYDDYSNGAAYFYDNKIEIWAPALDFDLRGTHNWLRNVITHEFTHIVQIQTSMKFGRRFPGFYLQWLNYEEERRQDVLYGYPNTIVSYPLSGFVIPSWFAEGVAQYNRPELSYDYWDSHRDMILRMYALDSNMLSWSEMSVFGKTSLGNESSYNAGFALSKYISETYGRDAIPRIAKNLSRVNMVTIDQAIERSIGKSGSELYDEWKNSVTEEYQRRTAPIYNKRVEGKTIADVGFGNFYPVFSPDGKKIAYTSNKKADYFGISSIFVYDLETKKEEEVISGVRSSLAWSADGKKIYYSKITHNNPHGSQVSDLYVVDVESKDEIRLTYGQRAQNPSLSFDGTKLCFVIGSDGTTNVAVSDTLGKNIRQVTQYTHGEQVYLPKWSPYGNTIVYGFSIKDGQDIAVVDIESGQNWFVLETDADERNPFYSADGLSIYFSSDVYGIFNIFRYDVRKQIAEQVTNVLGGAFMPSVNSKGDVAFASYTSSGYKINYLKQPEILDFSTSRYLEPQRIRRPELTVDTTSTHPADQFNWRSLRDYDDTKVFGEESKTYKNMFSSVSLIPFLRIDNYNTKNKGLDFLKPGLYFISSDMLEKFNMFGGAAINHILERDLFLIFEYRDRVIGFHQLGLHPTFSLELYNITRKSNARFGLGLDTVSTGTTLSLFEFDFFIKNHLFSELDVLTLGFTHSIYSSGFDFFVLPGDATHPPTPAAASSENYFVGNNLSLQWKFDFTIPSRTREINPVGRTFSLRLDNEFNNFTKEDSNGYSEVEVTSTGVKLKLFPYHFQRLEVRYTEHLQLPAWKHTLSFTLRGGTIFGPQVPDFFDFYAGGLVGMKGYPFYSIGGNEIATLNAAYRYPIWENIDFRIFQLYFDRLYGEFHADIGNAWDGAPTIRDFKKDIGFELRLEAFSWYAYPTRFFFNGTYGLDSFSLTKGGTTVSYGKEWRFYFGILFGFDFSNDITRMLRDPHGE
jgi:Tol biopolymer transport system component